MWIILFFGLEDPDLILRNLLQDSEHNTDTENSSQDTNGGNVSSSIKNSVITTHNMHDIYNKIVHTTSKERNYNLEVVNAGQQPTSVPLPPDAGYSAKYSSLSSGLSSQNGNSGTVLKLGNHEKVYSDGSKEIRYPNGVLKKISADGSVTKVIDVKKTSKDGTVKYFFVGPGCRSRSTEWNFEGQGDCPNNLTSKTSV